MIDARAPSLAVIEGTMFHYRNRVLANVVQFVEDIVSEGFKFGEYVLGHIRKAGKVFFGDNQRVPKDEVPQSRLGVEVLGFIDDFVLRIRRVRCLLDRTKEAIHTDSFLNLEKGETIIHRSRLISTSRSLFSSGDLPASSAMRTGTARIEPSCALRLNSGPAQATFGRWAGWLRGICWICLDNTCRVSQDRV